MERKGIESMTDIMIDDGPNPQPVTALHIWIATWDNGLESYVGVDLPPMPGGPVRHMPMISARLEVAKRFALMAQEAVQQSQAQTPPGRPKIVSMKLVTFVRHDP
jgi:hypothetical protein